MTRADVIPFREPREWEEWVPVVVRHLRAGGLIAYPTETVYGLGCALDASALDRLRQLKGREEQKPFLLLVAHAAQTPGLEWTAAARALADAFWPGPLTLILSAEPGRYPDAVGGSEGRVAVRATSHTAVHRLLAELGEPITSTSANRPEQPAASSAEETAAVLRELDAPADLWLLDGGELPASAPSTIVDCTGTRARVTRAGALPVESLQKVLGEIDA